MDVLSCVARPVFLLLIYADCDGNTASFPFPGKMGRTFCATISSTFPWPRTGTATTKAPITIAKFSFDFIARFFTAPPVFAMLLQQTAKQHFCEALRSRASGSWRRVREPTMGWQHATRVRYSNPSVTFSVALFIINA